MPLAWFSFCQSCSLSVTWRLFSPASLDSLFPRCICRRLVPEAPHSASSSSVSVFYAVDQTLMLSDGKRSGLRLGMLSSCFTKYLGFLSRRRTPRISLLRSRIAQTPNAAQRLLLECRGTGPLDLFVLWKHFRFQRVHRRRGHLSGKQLPCSHHHLIFQR